MVLRRLSPSIAKSQRYDINRGAKRAYVNLRRSNTITFGINIIIIIGLKFTSIYIS